jgi:hypothetical protein
MVIAAVGSVVGIGSGDGSVRFGALLHAPGAEMGLPPGRDLRHGGVALGIACCMRSASRTTAGRERRSDSGRSTQPDVPAGRAGSPRSVGHPRPLTLGSRMATVTQTAAEAEEALATARCTEPHQNVLIADPSPGIGPDPKQIARHPYEQASHLSL